MAENFGNGGSFAELNLQRDLARFIAHDCQDLIPEKHNLSVETRAMVLSGYVLNVASAMPLETYLNGLRVRVDRVFGRFSNQYIEGTLPTISAGACCREGYQLPESVQLKVATVLSRLH